MTILYLRKYFNMIVDSSVDSLARSFHRFTTNIETMLTVIQANNNNNNKNIIKYSSPTVENDFQLPLQHGAINLNPSLPNSVPLPSNHFGLMAIA